MDKCCNHDQTVVKLDNARLSTCSYESLPSRKWQIRELAKQSLLMDHRVKYHYPFVYIDLTSRTTGISTSL
jgi:hypothetical protein